MADEFSFEIILVIDKIDLQPGCCDRCDFDDEGAVDISDDDIHAGEPDHFMELVFPLVDAAVTGHERPDLMPEFLDSVGKIPAKLRYFVFRDIGEYLGIDKQDFFCGLCHIKNFVS